jgi:hypothetical protein
MVCRLPGLVGLVVLGLGACGGGSGGRVDGGGGGAGGGGGGSGGPGGGSGAGGGATGYVTGTVDGIVHRGDEEPEAGVQGLADGQIWIVAGAPPNAWTIYIENQVGTHECSAGGLVMLWDDVGTARSDQGGGCTVNVTSAAPSIGNIVEGTFTATLKDVSRTLTVTGGAFRVVRTNP